MLLYIQGLSESISCFYFTPQLSLWMRKLSMESLEMATSRDHATKNGLETWNQSVENVFEVLMVMVEISNKVLELVEKEKEKECGAHLPKNHYKWLQLEWTKNL